MRSLCVKAFAILSVVLLSSLLIACHRGPNFDFDEVLVIFYTGRGASAIERQFVPKGQTVTQPDDPISFEGDEFAGWFSDSQHTVLFDFSTPIDAPVIIYARWFFPLHTITYNLNGGTNNPENVSEFYSNTPTFALLNPTRVGFTFRGWYDGPDFTTATRIWQVYYGTREDIELWARWLASEFIMTFDVNGGNNLTTSTRRVAFGSQVNLPAAFIPTRDGYTFDGWFTAATGGTMYFDANGIAVIAWDIPAATTLFAQWS